MPHSKFCFEDAFFMAKAIRLAERGRDTTDPNPRVGCVLVKEGQIVGEGWHQKAGGPHAEIEALSAAGSLARGSTAYVSLEPCCHHGRTPPCSEALLNAGVARVVAAMTDPNPHVSGQGLRQLQDGGVTIASGLLHNEAEALNPGFLKRMRTGLPFIRSKIGMSLDGRTAMASGESQWITSPEARLDVHYLRARSSAILTGIDTVIADDPSLTVRLGERSKAFKPPLRVVLDSRFRMPVTATLLNDGGETLILTTELKPSEPTNHSASVEVVRVERTKQNRLDLKAVFALLGSRGINEVLVEAGATLNAALLQSGLVDEWVVYQAPKILGDEGRGLFHLPGLSLMDDAFELRLKEVRHIGPDIRMTLSRH